MTKRGDKDINKEVEDIRDKLFEINKRVKEFVGQKKPPRRAKSKKSSLSASIPKSVSLEQMREKLYAINKYLREQAGVKAPITIREEPVVKEEEAVIKEEEPVAREEEAVVKAEKPADEIPYITQPMKAEGGGRPGIGLDLGTSYIVAAREAQAKGVFVKSERNACLVIKFDKVTQDLLVKLKIKYMALGENMYILSDSALHLANIFSREVQRPMSEGIINPSEAESIPMIKMLIQNIVWSPREEREICCFSIPSAPIDRGQDTIYHRSVFEGILKNLGFELIVIDEGYAVVLAELGYKDFTGIGISCGGGLVNVCAAFRSIPAISFSISRGGDWIDRSAASVLGVPSSRVTAAKEHGMSLKNPLNREEEAITVYYRNFIHYFLENMARVFNRSSNAPQFKEPVDIVLAGGSAMVGGFLDVVKEEIKSLDLRFAVDSVKKAEDPFTTVARGCLFNAISAGAKRDAER